VNPSSPGPSVLPPSGGCGEDVWFAHSAIFAYPRALMNLTNVSAVLAAQKEKSYRLDQIKRAFYVDLARSWDDVTTLSQSLREQLSAEVPWDVLTPITTQESSDGDTVKTLFECADGKKIEAVLMRHDGGRNTVCISSQVGCPMACTFCATGTMGLTRNLKSDEMVEQVVHFARWLKDHHEDRITNVVYMGMGEPMHNYDAVLESVRLLNDAKALGIGSRHISISTCGIVPGIKRFADEGLQVNLAISLHSAIDATRSKIMPVNNPYPVAKLMQAVVDYVEKTNRKVMFEYLMLKGINDTREEAEALADLMSTHPKLFHVNIIKYHDTDAYTSTAEGDRHAFLRILKERGVSATHRRTFGEDIDAACGQLAVSEEPGSLAQGKMAVRENRSKQKR
jgi:23S rRNA (adenine2503-C2)-methyltransferase